MVHSMPSPKSMDVIDYTQIFPSLPNAVRDRCVVACEIHRYTAELGCIATKSERWYTGCSHILGLSGRALARDLVCDKTPGEFCVDFKAIIDGKTRSEQVAAMHLNWDRLASSADGARSIDWHGDELAKRVATVQNGTAKFVDGADAKKRLQAMPGKLTDTIVQALRGADHLGSPAMQELSY